MRRWSIFALAGVATAAGAPSSAAQESPVSALATEYVAALVAREPERLTYQGVPGAAHDQLLDNSRAALERWHRLEDALLARVRRFEPPTPGERDWTTYAIMLDALDASVGHRVCRSELWAVRTSGGLQNRLSLLARAQPVGSDSLRAQALTRWRRVPRYVDTEIANLREGVRQGYVAPRPVVAAVIRDVAQMLAAAPASSPLASPAQRDSSAEFRRAFVAVVANEINPALERYRAFLADEYLAQARTSIAASAGPAGLACYCASVRRSTTLDLPGDSIFERGTRELARLERAIGELGQRVLGTSHVPTVLRRLRTDTALTFRTRQEIMDTTNAAIARASAALPKWFGILPKAELVVEQQPEYQQRAGNVAYYNRPSEDGTRPGIFFINTFAPEQQSRARIESTAFHEAVPGHHLQVTIAAERGESHPLARLLFNSGYGEGWALYAETVAGEMGVYSSAVARLGLLTSQAFRATRMVLDAGIHTKGWTREQAVEFLAAHSVVAPKTVESEVDRYISMPGQASSYMLGNLEIRALRTEAERRMGKRFDIRQFHDRVLEDGSLPLPALRSKVLAWLDTVAPVRDGASN
jgi:uncharacterized protein (DUF885 family)